MWDTKLNRFINKWVSGGIILHWEEIKVNIYVENHSVSKQVIFLLIDSNVIFTCVISFLATLMWKLINLSELAEL